MRERERGEIEEKERESIERDRRRGREKKESHENSQYDSHFNPNQINKFILNIFSLKYNNNFKLIDNSVNIMAGFTVREIIGSET